MSDENHKDQEGNNEDDDDTPKKKRESSAKLIYSYPLGPKFKKGTR